MRSLAIAVAVGLAAAPALAAPPPLTACNGDLRVTDRDPNGLNVRASPDGAILTALKAKDREVEVHVTGATGQWAEIDTATLVGASGETTLFKGHGFVAFSKLGIVSVWLAAPLLAAPSDGAREITLRTIGDTGALPDSVLGCSGAYVKLRVRDVVGWARAF